MRQQGVVRLWLSFDKLNSCMGLTQRVRKLKIHYKLSISINWSSKYMLDSQSLCSDSCIHHFCCLHQPCSCTGKISLQWDKNFYPRHEPGNWTRVCDLPYGYVVLFVHLSFRIKMGIYPKIFKITAIICYEIVLLKHFMQMRLRQAMPKNHSNLLASNFSGKTAFW